MVGFGSVVAIVYSIQTYVDWRIETQLSDPATLRRIAAAAKPEIILDGKGSIIADMGGMDYLADIKTVPWQQHANMIKTIILTPKKYMAIPPLVSSIDATALRTTSTRGVKLDWRIEIEYDSFEPEGLNRIRVEMLER